MIKTKRKSLSKLKKEVWAVFSPYIRTRDCLETTGSTEVGLCFTCDRPYPLKELQAGHFVSGRHNANLFSERGTHAQCFNCNITLRGNPLEYRRRINKKYGEGADLELEQEARQTVKFTVADLEQMKLDLKQRIKEIDGGR